LSEWKGGTGGCLLAAVFLNHTARPGPEVFLVQRPAREPPGRLRWAGFSLHHPPVKRKLAMTTSRRSGRLQGFAMGKFIYFLRMLKKLLCESVLVDRQGKSACPHGAAGIGDKLAGTQ